jgi:hypothetical protein
MEIGSCVRNSEIRIAQNNISENFVLHFCSTIIFESTTVPSKMEHVHLVNGGFRFTTKVYFLPESKLSNSVNNITSKTAWMLTSNLFENNANIVCMHQKFYF